MTQDASVRALDGVAPVPLVLFAWGDDGQPVIRVANRLAGDLLGRSPADLAGLSLTGLLPFEELETLADAVEDAGAEPSPSLLLHWGDAPLSPSSGPGCNGWPTVTWWPPSST